MPTKLATPPPPPVVAGRVLARLPATDPLDKNFPLRAMLEAPSPLDHRYWNANGWWGDQLRTSQCCAFMGLHWLEDGPTGQRGTAPVIPPLELYRDAQERDEWDGPPPDYDGTSVRAIAKALQARGYIGSYHWPERVNDMIEGVLTKGPLLGGSIWTQSMFKPDAKGILTVTGRPEGGHAYVVNGVSRVRRMFRIKNSWGRGWGQLGHAWIRFDDMERLLEEAGEFCLAVEIKKAA